jgi:hypothetical protein
VKYLLIFLLVLAIFVISVTLGAQNDQQVTFNYLLARANIASQPAGRSFCCWFCHWLADLWSVLAARACFSGACGT